MELCYNYGIILYGGRGIRTEGMTIERLETVTSYFYKRLHELLTQYNLRLSELTQFYLLNLMEDLIKVDSSSYIMEGPTIIEMLNELGELQGKAKADGWRKIGEYVLITQGLFSENVFARTGIREIYYLNWGKIAYMNSAKLYKVIGLEDLGFVCKEVGTNFETVVKLLEKAVPLDDTATPKGIIKLLDRWLKTKKNWMKERLINKGVVLLDGYFNDRDKKN